LSSSSLPGMVTGLARGLQATRQGGRRSGRRRDSSRSGGEENWCSFELESVTGGGNVGRGGLPRRAMRCNICDASAHACMGSPWHGRACVLRRRRARLRGQRRGPPSPLQRRPGGAPWRRVTTDADKGMPGLMLLFLRKQSRCGVLRPSPRRRSAQSWCAAGARRSPGAAGAAQSRPWWWGPDSCRPLECRWGPPPIGIEGSPISSPMCAAASGGVGGAAAGGCPRRTATATGMTHARSSAWFNKRGPFLCALGWGHLILTMASHPTANADLGLKPGWCI
jgi:hypothetical protein